MSSIEQDQSKYEVIAYQTPHTGDLYFFRDRVFEACGPSEAYTRYSYIVRLRQPAIAVSVPAPNISFAPISSASKAEQPLLVNEHVDEDGNMVRQEVYDFYLAAEIIDRAATLISDNNKEVK